MKSGTVFIRKVDKQDNKNTYSMCGIIVTDEDNLFEGETLYKICNLDVLKQEKLQNKGGWGFDDLLQLPIWKV